MAPFALSRRVGVRLWGGAAALVVSTLCSFAFAGPATSAPAATPAQPNEAHKAHESKEKESKEIKECVDPDAKGARPSDSKSKPNATLELVFLKGAKEANAKHAHIPAEFANDLKESPHNEYNVYKSIGTCRVSLTTDAASKVLLPNGASLEVTLLKPDDKAVKEKKNTLSLGVIGNKSKKPVRIKAYPATGVRFMPIVIPLAKDGAEKTVLVVALKVL